MWTKKILVLISCACMLSCHNSEQPATALDTGRAFIRATLDGDFSAAESFLFRDTMNIQLFDSYKSFYGRLEDVKKKKYKESDYTINKYLDIDDSTTIINYSNSYMRKPMEVKVIKKNKRWQVDFKYTPSGNLPIN